MLISAIHAAAVKFPDAAASVVPTLMDFLGDAHQSSAVDVVLFVRDMVESFEIEVPFVRTADNLADFFTKPIKSASQFHALRKVVMNEA